MKYLSYLYGFFTFLVFILISYLLISKPQNSKNILGIVMVLTFINAILFCHRWYLQLKSQKINLDLKSKIQTLEKEEKEDLQFLEKELKNCEDVNQTLKEKLDLKEVKVNDADNFSPTFPCV